MFHPGRGGGKFIAGYERRITFPVGAHFYLDGTICEVIRSISGFKAPTGILRILVLRNMHDANARPDPDNFGQVVPFPKSPQKGMIWSAKSV